MDTRLAIIEAIEDAEIAEIEAREEFDAVASKTPISSHEEYNEKHQLLQKATKEKHEVVAHAISQGDEWMTDPETCLCVSRSFEEEEARCDTSNPVTEALERKFDFPEIQQIKVKYIERKIRNDRSFDGYQIVSYPYIALRIDIREMDDNDAVVDVVEEYYNTLQDDYVLAYALDHAELEVQYDSGIATISAFTEDKYMVSYDNNFEKAKDYEVSMKPAKLQEAIRFIREDLNDWLY